MNATVQAAGLPPMIGLVVDQYPIYQDRAYKISRVAEDPLTKAGAEIIPTEDYYRRYNNQSMYVSKFEGHPNEVADYIWAAMIMQRLNQREDIAHFRR